MTTDKNDTLDDFFDIAIVQNLTKLNLNSFGHMACCHDKDERVQFGKVLEKILNSQSQEMLKEIRINGEDAIFMKNWVKDVYQLIPSVTKLHLPYCPLSLSPNFTNLCQFKNVTELDISCSELKNLTGISNIKNLELLNLSNLEFREKEDVLDLFNLEKLRVLNISSFRNEDRLQNLKLYLQCKKSLPQLRFLDCSNNDINLKDLYVLVETHPMLEVVCLLETPLEKNPQIEFPGRTVELLTIENAHRCLISLNYCMQTIKYLGDVKRIFNECAEFLENLNASDQDYKDCVKLMLFFIKKYKDNETYQEYSLDCLLCACQKAHLLDVNEKHHLIRTILDSLSDYACYENDADDEPISVVHYIAFNILCRKEICEASPQAIDAVCKGIADVFRFASCVRPWTTPWCCLMLLKQLTRKITSLNALDVAGLKIHLLQIFMKYDIEETGEETFFVLVHVMNDLTYVNRESRAEDLILRCDKTIIQGIITTIANLDNDSQKRDVLNMLEEYVKFVDVSVFESFFHRFEEFLMPSVLAKNTEEQKAVVSVLGAMMCCEDLQANPLTEQTLNAILQSLNSFDISEDTDAFRYIVRTSDNREAVKWAKWILKSCGVVVEEEEDVVKVVPEEIVPEEAREEEPEAKKRKL